MLEFALKLVDDNYMAVLNMLSHDNFRRNVKMTEEEYSKIVNLNITTELLNAVFELCYPSIDIYRDMYNVLNDIEFYKSKGKHELIDKFYSIKKKFYVTVKYIFTEDEIKNSAEEFIEVFPKYKVNDEYFLTFDAAMIYAERFKEFKFKILY